MECKCGCGKEVRGSNIFILGHNRKGKEGAKLGDRWSVNYEFCIECNTNNFPYSGNGLCTSCYKKVRYKNFDWKGKVCKDCKKDNKPHKAKGLCDTCYGNYRNRQKGVPTRRFGAWSQLYDKCQSCGTTEREHAARGLCKDCIDSQKRTGDLTECPVCKVPVLKLNQHLSMRSRKCALHKEYQRELFTMYFNSDLSLIDIAEELETERHIVSYHFHKIFGKEVAKERIEKVRGCNISEKAIINKNYKNIFGTPTFYESKENGLVKFRSKIEAKYAAQLDEKGISWRYEAAHFPYINKEGIRKTYTPDFFLSEENKYIEIKSSDLYDEDDEYKVEWVKDHTPINIEVVFMK